MPRTLVVLGGALAGPTAAARAREYDDHARIVLVERNTHVSYGTTALPYRLSGEVAATPDLDREGPEHLAHRFGLETRLATRTVAIRPAAHEVVIARGDEEETLVYDALVYAHGAATVVPDVPGLAGANVRPLRTMQDLAALEATLASGGRRVLVLGGGTLGLEAADGLLRAGAEVTVVEREALLPGFGERVRAAVVDALRERVSLAIGVTAVSASGTDERVTRVALSDGRTVEVDYVVLAPGVRPRTEHLGAAGITLLDDGSVPIDAGARTSAPDVYACGSCVAVPRVDGGTRWTAQAAILDRTAQVAGANAAGGAERLRPFAGTLVTRVGDVVVGRTGASEAEAVARYGTADVGVAVLHGRAEDGPIARVTPLLLELVYRRSNGALLGLEAVGGGVERRVDVAATALVAGLDVHALAMIDLGYVPPLGAARDPLNAVAGIALAETRGLGRLTTSIGPRRVVDVGTHASVPGAPHLPLSSLRATLAQLDPTAPLCLVSHTGREAWLASRILLQRGFRDVAVLAGGARSLSHGGKP